MVAVLANTSHGDASIAALDLDTHLVPKKPAAADPDLVRRSGRGIAYTRSAFAYLFPAEVGPGRRAAFRYRRGHPAQDGLPRLEP